MKKTLILYVCTLVYQNQDMIFFNYKKKTEDTQKVQGPEIYFQYQLTNLMLSKKILMQLSSITVKL